MDSRDATKLPNARGSFTNVESIQRVTDYVSQDTGIELVVGRMSVAMDDLQAKFLRDRLIDLFPIEQSVTLDPVMPKPHVFVELATEATLVPCPHCYSVDHADDCPKRTVATADMETHVLDVIERLRDLKNRVNGLDVTTVRQGEELLDELWHKIKGG